MVSEKKFKSFVEGGHVFELEDDGVKVYDSPDGWHGFIQCVVCDDGECYACDPDFKSKICVEREKQPSLPGLEYFLEGETNAD